MRNRAWISSVAALTIAAPAAAQTVDHVINVNLPDHAHIETRIAIDSDMKPGGHEVASHYSVQYDDVVTRNDGGYHIARDVSQVHGTAKGGYDYNYFTATFAVAAFAEVPHVEFTVDPKFGPIQVDNMPAIRAAILKANIFAPGASVSDDEIIKQLDLDPFIHDRLSDVSFYGVPLTLGQTQTLPTEDVKYGSQAVTYARALTLVAWDEATKTAHLHYSHAATGAASAAARSPVGCDVEVDIDTGLMRHTDCHYQGGIVHIVIDRKLLS